MDAVAGGGGSGWHIMLVLAQSVCERVAGQDISPIKMQFHSSLINEPRSFTWEGHAPHLVAAANARDRERARREKSEEGFCQLIHLNAWTTTTTTTYLIGPSNASNVHIPMGGALHCELRNWNAFGMSWQSSSAMLELHAGWSGWAEWQVRYESIGTDVSNRFPALHSIPSRASIDAIAFHCCQEARLGLGSSQPVQSFRFNQAQSYVDGFRLHVTAATTVLNRQKHVTSSHQPSSTATAATSWPRHPERGWSWPCSWLSNKPKLASIRHGWLALSVDHRTLA